MERKTPLYDLHVAEGGKIVPFAGYLLPVQYGTGVIQEHMAVRQKAGLFDVSHMGEILFTGPTALDSLNHLLTNDYRNMPVNKVRYGVMCNAQGGTIDDLVVYKFGEESYLAVVNAANREKDYAHMAANVLEGTQCRDISDTVAQLALQGPKAPAILKKLLPEDQIPKGYYTALPNVDLQGIKCLISRTGYTGELGYEIYTSNEDAPKLWKLLREAGEEFGLIPCGLGARDTLRLEAAMPLYGHEMDETITPLEAGLDFGVKLDKAAFIGKDALVSALSKLPGVTHSSPEGAFYVMATLPVDDAEKLQYFLLQEFEDRGETVMYAPGEGFYGTPGKGKNEVRIAYVTNPAELTRAIELLGLGIEAYNRKYGK